MPPKISVLIPVYNAGKYLPNCLESILSQTLQDFEVLCLNDGSTDASLSVLEAFSKADARIRLINQENAGVAQARNRLLDEATGKYIAWVDADDWVEPVYLEKLYRVVQETDADVSKCLFKEFDTISQTFQAARCSSFFRSVPGNSVADKLKHGYYDSVVWGKLWRAEFLRAQSLKFLPGHVAEDVAWVSLGFAHANKIVLVAQELYVYRKGVSGAITSNSANMAFGKLRNIFFLGEELDNRNLLEGEISSFLLKLILWNMCNLRKMPKGEQNKNASMFSFGIGVVKKLVPHIGFWARLRFRLWMFLAGRNPSLRFYFWSKVFR